MYTRPTEPRSIGGVLDDGLRLWRDCLSKTWPLALLAQLSVAVPLVILSSKYPALNTAVPSRSLSAANVANAQALLALFKSPLTWLAYLLIIVLSVWLYTAIVLRITAVAAAAVSSLGGSLIGALRMLPRLLLQILIFFAALVFAGVMLALLGAVSSNLGSGGKLVTLLMGVAGIFGILFVFGRVYFASIVLILENAGPADSIGISWVLTRGYWWRCAAIVVVLIIIGLVFNLVVGLVAATIGAALGTGFSSTALSQTLSVAANTVLGSLYPAVSVAIVYDLKLRKQGGDLLGRVDSLALQ